jgi:hypothetical protein
MALRWSSWTPAGREEKKISEACPGAPTKLTKLAADPSCGEKKNSEAWPTEVTKLTKLAAVETDLIVVQDESEAEQMGLRPGTWITQGDLTSLAVFGEEERRKIFRTMLIIGGRVAGVEDLRRDR